MQRANEKQNEMIYQLNEMLREAKRAMAADKASGQVDREKLEASVRQLTTVALFVGGAILACNIVLILYLTLKPARKKSNLFTGGSSSSSLIDPRQSPQPLIENQGQESPVVVMLSAQSSFRKLLPFAKPQSDSAKHRRNKSQRSEEEEHKELK